MKIDWAMLREQKQWLLNFNDEQAIGLVYLLDALQDQAVESGESTEIEVFGQE